MYHFRAQIAKSLKHKRYGFVFGCNMFLALLIETILTVIVVDKAGLGVDVQTQVCTFLHEVIPLNSTTKGARLQKLDYKRKISKWKKLDYNRKISKWNKN